MQFGFVGLGKMGSNMVHRLRRDGDHARHHVQPRLVGPQKQAQRQSGDERRAQIVLRQGEEARAQSLRRQRAADRQHAVERPGAEIEPPEIENEQSRERRHLIVARIGPDSARRRTGRDQ